MDQDHSDDTYQAPSTAKSVAAFVVPLFVLLLIFTMRGPDPAGGLTGLIGYSAVAAAMLFFSFYYFWMRDSRKWVKITAFIVIFLGCLFVSLIKGGSTIDTMNKQMEATSNLKLDEHGKVIVPENFGDEGPATKLMAEFIRKNQKISADFEREWSELNLATLGSAPELAKDRSPLKNCDRFRNFKSRIEIFRSRTNALAPAFLQEARKIDAPASYVEGLVAGMKSSMAEASDFNEKNWAIHNKNADIHFDLCSLLANSKWQAQGNDFAFQDQRTVDQFNAILARSNAMTQEQTAIFQRRRERLQNNQAEMKEMLK